MMVIVDSIVPFTSARSTSPSKEDAGGPAPETRLVSHVAVVPNEFQSPHRHGRLHSCPHVTFSTILEFSLRQVSRPRGKK